MSAQDPHGKPWATAKEIDDGIPASSAAPVRVAKVSGTNDHVTVRAYLPANYVLLGPAPDGFVIGGRDNAGWTLNDYVIPRLASGLIWAEEITERAALELLVEAL